MKSTYRTKWETRLNELILERKSLLVLNHSVKYVTREFSRGRRRLMLIKLRKWDDYQFVTYPYPFSTTFLSQFYVEDLYCSLRGPNSKYLRKFHVDVDRIRSETFTPNPRGIFSTIWKCYSILTSPTLRHLKWTRSLFRFI